MRFLIGKIKEARIILQIINKQANQIAIKL